MQFADDIAPIVAATGIGAAVLTSNVGSRIATGDMKSFLDLTAADGIYYAKSLNTLVITKDGASFSGINFSGVSINVQASNVTLQDCNFDASVGSYAINALPGTSNLTIDHSTFDGLKLDKNYADFVSSRGLNTTVTNDAFLNAPADAVAIDSGTISQNYFHGSGYMTGAHADAVWVGSTIAPLAVTDNIIDWRTPADARTETNNPIRITGETGNVSDVLVQHNIILGGSYTVLVTNTPTLANSTVGTVSDVRVVDNVVDDGKYGSLYQNAVPAGSLYQNNIHATGPAPSPGEAATGVLPDLNGYHLISATGTSSNTVPFYGTPGNDEIVIDGTSKMISAGDGNDIVFSGPSRDYLSGGNGSDIFVYDAFNADTTKDYISDFTQGQDRIDLAGLPGVPTHVTDWEWLGSQSFTADPWQIHYLQSNGSTYIQIDADGDLKPDFQLQLAGTYALTSADFILAAPSVTKITGTASNDTLVGTSGDDIITGGGGRDTLTGGGGHDVFAYTSTSDSAPSATARDLITDFHPGPDLIDLSTIDANPSSAANDSFTWLGTGGFTGHAGELRYQVSNGTASVQVDTNGDKIADMQIDLAGVTSLNMSDFTHAQASAPNTVFQSTAQKDIWYSDDGHDTFTFHSTADSLPGTAARDVIRDFTPGKDVIDLSQIDANPSSNVADSFTWLGTGNFTGHAGELRYATVGGGVIVLADTNGDKNPDMQIEVDGVTSLGITDFKGAASPASAPLEVFTSTNGQDTWFSGTGHDTFVFTSIANSPPSSRDLITGFTPGKDYIDLTAIDANPQTAIHDPLFWIGTAQFNGHAGDLRYSTVGGGVVVQADLNGDKIADFQIQIGGPTILHSSDFFF